MGALIVSCSQNGLLNVCWCFTLQDTAGQERFSSLSSAFFRGADAVLMMFDVNKRETMIELSRWWGEFVEKRPLNEGDVRRGFCVGIVGNKVDMLEGGVRGERGAVEEEEARRFLSGLIPVEEETREGEGQEVIGNGTGDGNPEIIKVYGPDSATSPANAGPTRTRTRSIDIASTLQPRPAQLQTTTTPSRSPHHNLLSASSSTRRRSRSAGTSSARLYSVGTLGSTNTIYHTPSSSFFDVYESARSSPYPFPDSPSSPSPSPLGSVNMRAEGRRLLSTSSLSSSGTSAPTITPSLFAARNRTTSGATAPSVQMVRDPPEIGPKLFWTSAKSGQGVSDVFEYVAKRVVRMWEWEEERGREVDGVWLGIGENFGANGNVILGGGKSKRAGWCC
jgi:Ras-related protein Rab-7A